MEKLSAAHAFNYIVLRVNPGLISCEDLAMALLSDDNQKKGPAVMKDSYFVKQRKVIFEQSNFNLHKQRQDETVDYFITKVALFSKTLCI